jgi:hypothetical protein
MPSVVRLPAEDGRRRRPPAGPALRMYRKVSQPPQQHGHNGAGRRHAAPPPASPHRRMASNAKHRRFAPARRHGVRLTRPTNSLSLQVIR